MFSNGKIGIMSNEAMREFTGLSETQITRGTRELRDKEIITPVVRKTKAGVMREDRSRFGHVAQYRFTSDCWAQIRKEEGAANWLSAGTGRKTKVV